MAVLGVTAIAVGTTTTKTIAQSGSTGGTTGGGPSSAASHHRSVRHVVAAHGSFSHGTAATVTIDPIVERSGTTTLAAPITVPPIRIDRVLTAQYWPVPLLEQFRALIDSPAAAIAAATVAGGPIVAGVGPVATAAVTGSHALAVAPSTLRPVPEVVTPTAVLPAPDRAAAPVVMTPAVLALAVASGLSASPAWTAPATQGPLVLESSGPAQAVAGLSDWSSPQDIPSSIALPAESVPTASEAPAPGFPAPPIAAAAAAAGCTPPPAADGPVDPGSGPTAPAPPTGGTASDADAASLQARATPATPSVPMSGTAGAADAQALQRHPTVGAAPEVRTLPIIGSTTAFETAAASIDSTDAAAAMQLAHALDASGKGFTSVTWNEDSRSNAAVLRLGAAEAWSRHEKERAELFADARQASAGLRAQTGFDQLLVRQLLGAD